MGSLGTVCKKINPLENIQRRATQNIMGHADKMYQLVLQGAELLSLRAISWRHSKFGSSLQVNDQRYVGVFYGMVKWRSEKKRAVN